MLKKINEINVIEPASKEEVKMFSYIMHHIKKIRYGSVSFEVRVHNEKLTNIKCIRSEESISLHND